MEDYSRISQDLAMGFTRQYSSSFGRAARLFQPATERDICNIYGLVRLADEIVDSYHGPDAAGLLQALEAESYEAIERGFSINPIVQAFAVTARRSAIGRDIIAPFFDSMRMDLQPQAYDKRLYETYIYGSAEVVGLMCLKVFCVGQPQRFEELSVGARRLGAAYQKINFLRDFGDDVGRLGRSYFPNVEGQQLTEASKQAIVDDIRQDLTVAGPYVRQLPADARRAVSLSLQYYNLLLDKLAAAPASQVASRRLRISDGRKLWLYVRYRLLGETK